MEFSKEDRQKFSIASTMEELSMFALQAEIAGHKGFPVLLIPFGCEEERETWKRVENNGELEQAAQDLFYNAMWGLVHVLKAWPVGSRGY